MTKAIISVTINPEVKEKVQEILRGKNLSLSGEIEKFLKSIIEKEAKE